MSNSKILFYSTFAILFTNFIQAQSTEKFSPDTASHIEVGINTTPAIVFVVGAEAAQNYVLSFRKQHNKRAFQIKAVFNQAVDNISYAPQITYQDSTISNYQTYVDPEKYVGMAAGLEFYNPKKHIRWYWGFDLLARYYLNRKSQTTYTYTVDSTISPIPPNTYFTSVGQLETFQWATGAGIKGGVRIPLSKHFFIQTETHIHIVYIFKGTSKSYEDVSKLTKPSSDTWNINTDGLIPELTLFYRF